MPVVLSVLVIAVAARVWPPEELGISVLVWWVIFIGLAMAVLVFTDRIARRFLPLSILLRMALVFPDQAPSRFGAALRYGTAKKLLNRNPPTSHALMALVQSISHHDRATRGHSERVRAYSQLIGQELRLEQGDLDRLSWAALLHDVGKLEVSAEILNKKGRPDDTEWEELRQHPAKAPAYLVGFEHWMGDWGRAASEHHERWDGKGYPQGLDGESIHQAGRIVAVADAYDVMTSVRSYKKSMPTGVAREEIARNAGSQFDPTAVRAFLNVGIGQVNTKWGAFAWFTQIPDMVSRAPAAGLVAAIGIGASLGLIDPGAKAATEPVTVIEQVEDADAVDGSTDPLLDPTPTPTPTPSPAGSAATGDAGAGGDGDGGDGDGGDGDGDDDAGDDSDEDDSDDAGDDDSDDGEDDAGDDDDAGDAGGEDDSGDSDDAGDDGGGNASDDDSDDAGDDDSDTGDDADNEGDDADADSTTATGSGGAVASAATNPPLAGASVAGDPTATPTPATAPTPTPTTNPVLALLDPVPTAEPTVDPLAPPTPAPEPLPPRAPRPDPTAIPTPTATPAPTPTPLPTPTPVPTPVPTPTPLPTPTPTSTPIPTPTPTPAPIAPLAVDDLFMTVPSGIEVVLDVLTNDTTQGGSPLDWNTIAFTVPPLHANTTPNVYGPHIDHIDYQSVDGYTGPDSFEYEICNTDGLCARAFVIIEVIPGP